MNTTDSQLNGGDGVIHLESQDVNTSLGGNINIIKNPSQAQSANRRDNFMVQSQAFTPDDFQATEGQKMEMDTNFQS